MVNLFQIGKFVGDHFFFFDFAVELRDEVEQGAVRESASSVRYAGVIS